MTPNAVEGGSKSSSASGKARMSTPGSDLHRQPIRHIYQTAFQQLHPSAPQAVSHSRRMRPSSPSDRSQTSDTLGQGTDPNKTAMPRHLMAKKAFTSV